MQHIAVNPAIIDWAITRAPDFARLRQQFAKLDQWRSGESQPTLNQLEHFARATFTPFGYFFLPDPPTIALPIPHYRTKKDAALQTPSPNLIDTVHEMERRQAWLREYLIDQGHAPLSFVGTDQNNKSAEQVAAHIRAELGLEELWASEQKTWSDALTELRERIDTIGIVVSISGIVGNNTHRILNPDEFRGFVLIDEYAPVIFVNGTDSKAAQMFTLAHELAHVWLGKSAAFDLANLECATEGDENLCNQIAAEFLVPSKNMLEFWIRVKNDPDAIHSAARHFKVSQLVIARRALDLRLITRAHFFAFYQEYMSSEHMDTGTKSSGGDFYRTAKIRLGRRFAENVVRAVRSGTLLYRDAYQLTGLHGNTFERFATQL